MSADSQFPSDSELIRSYTRADSAYDELKSDAGTLRPHWRTLLDRIEQLGHAELARRWQKANQLLHQNGVSYNVYGDPQGMDRPWSLSPVPVVLPADEWQVLEEGLAQRARLRSRCCAGASPKTATARARCSRPCSRLPTAA